MKWKFWEKQINIEAQLEPVYWHSWALMPYMMPSPQQEIIAMRREWDSPKVIRLSDMSPAFNVANLYWKSWQGITINQSIN